MSVSRRDVIKAGAVAGGLITSGNQTTASPSVSGQPIHDGAATFESDWDNANDRVWLGEEFWANPMEDWKIVDGQAECLTTGGDRNIHLVTHQLTSPDAGFEMSVRVKQVEKSKSDGGAGFRIGIRSDINEYRSNCFAKGGFNAGIIDGQLLLGRKREKPTRDLPVDSNLRISLHGSKAADESVTLTLLVSDDQGVPFGQIVTTVPSRVVTGNIALVNNFDAAVKKGQGARYRFSAWKVSGAAFTITESNKFGPILWSMYSLSDSRGDDGFVMKISALTGPLGDKDQTSVELQVEENGQWIKRAAAQLDPDAWTATIRVSHWDESKETAYRLVYRESHPDGSVTETYRSGIIKANPVGRPLRLGALTCQKDYAFPYEPVANNLLKLNPDMLYFSGDQLYENHGGYGLIRDPAGPAILNYLRKFYMFGWSFGETMRDRPTLCIPDDHDVFQGNIWGEGGTAMKSLDQGASSKGGYREPARMVNVVHKTCAGHHPDFFDPTPCEQNISVYYGDVVYGGVSFAVLGDRQFKSGPERVETGSGRADHVRDPDFDCAALDKPGLVLLGDRQEKFLDHWAADWRGHQMKVLLSQTVFAGVATHHGGYSGYLKADLDSGAWPQTARNDAIRIIRKAKCLHINGDQHLTTLCQYGVDQQRDSNWSFCTPAIAAGYPRWWRPDEVDMPHRNRPKHGLPNTGEFRDGFGNRVYVYAVGNPEVGKEKNRYDLAHQKGSGFGIVTIDSDARTYHIESFRFLIDATDGSETNQFPGWPVTIQQSENSGDNTIG